MIERRMRYQTVKPNQWTTTDRMFDGVISTKPKQPSCRECIWSCVCVSVCVWRRWFGCGGVGIKYIFSLRPHDAGAVHEMNGQRNCVKRKTRIEKNKIKKAKVCWNVNDKQSGKVENVRRGICGAWWRSACKKKKCLPRSLVESREIAARFRNARRSTTIKTQQSAVRSRPITCQIDAGESP